jgi:hypothetical protein
MNLKSFKTLRQPNKQSMHNTPSLGLFSCISSGILKTALSMPVWKTFTFLLCTYQSFWSGEDPFYRILIKTAFALLIKCYDLFQFIAIYISCLMMVWSPVLDGYLSGRPIHAHSISHLPGLISWSGPRLEALWWGGKLMTSLWDC